MLKNISTVHKFYFFKFMLDKSVIKDSDWYNKNTVALPPWTICFLKFTRTPSYAQMAHKAHAGPVSTPGKSILQMIDLCFTNPPNNSAFPPSVREGDGGSRDQQSLSDSAA